MPILSNEAIAQFHQEGFLLLSNVFEIKDLLDARARIESAFLEKNFHGQFDSEHLLTDIFSHFEGLEKLVFNEKVIEIAQILLNSQAILIPECAIHRNRFINWHKDTTVQEMAGVKSHAAQNAFPILQFALYFQENSENGGGLTVIPATHQMPDPFLALYSKNRILRFWQKLLKILHLSVFDSLEKHPQKLDISNKLGDLLVFDVRIFHRATFSKKSKTSDKLAIFNTFIQENEAGLDYFEFMKGRSEPYYRYFREKPLPDSIYEYAEKLNLKILY